MSMKHLLRLRLPAALVAIGLVSACGGQPDAPAPPQTADPAPPPAVATAEDRGLQPAGEAPAPASDEHAFSNVESGEAERAASKRGHESAGEAAPAPAPGSGG